MLNNSCKIEGQRDISELCKILDNLGLQQLSSREEMPPEPRKFYPTTGDGTEIERVKSLAKDYQKQLRAHQERIKRSCIRKRIETIWALLDENYQQLLEVSLEAAFKRLSLPHGAPWGPVTIWTPLPKIFSDEKLGDIANTCVCLAEDLLVCCFTGNAGRARYS